MKDEQKIIPMDAGELEVRKAFEEVTTRNVKGVVNFSNETRKIIRSLEVKILHLEELMREKDGIINNMRQQISLIQQKLYKGGTV